MNLSHEYNLAREHVSSIDFTYLVPSARATFSTVLPPIEDMELPESPQLDDGPQGTTRRPMFSGLMTQHSPTCVLSLLSLHRKADTPDAGRSLPLRPPSATSAA